jgi:hypothetical protein
MTQEILSLCREIRGFLEPRWLRLHKLWGEHQPITPSQQMCRYTSIFLKEVLENFSDESWWLVAGRPLNREVEGTKDGYFGFCTSQGLFFDHCWVQSANLIVDLTADQFEAEPIIITSTSDSRYHPNLNEVDLWRDIEKLSRRSQKWSQDWLREYRK